MLLIILYYSDYYKIIIKFLLGNELIITHFKPIKHVCYLLYNIGLMAIQFLCPFISCSKNKNALWKYMLLDTSSWNNFYLVLDHIIYCFVSSHYLYIKESSYAFMHDQTIYVEWEDPNSWLGIMWKSYWCIIFKPFWIILSKKEK